MTLACFCFLFFMFPLPTARQGCRNGLNHDEEDGSEHAVNSVEEDRERERESDRDCCCRLSGAARGSVVAGEAAASTPVVLLRNPPLEKSKNWCPVGAEEGGRGRGGYIMHLLDALFFVAWCAHARAQGVEMFMLPLFSSCSSSPFVGGWYLPSCRLSSVRGGCGVGTRG